MPTSLTAVTVLALLVSGSLWVSLRVAALPAVASTVTALPVTTGTQRQLLWRRHHARTVYVISTAAVVITALLALR